MLKLDRMNEAQRAAVTHGAGPLLLLAGPGSGKTFTIIHRILYLIEEKNIPPEKILVITFTKDAARSMEQRFHGLANQRFPFDPLHPVNFGTFHSAFYHILRKSNPSYFKELWQESQKRNLLLSLLKNQAADGAGAEASTYLSGISYYKNTGDREKAKAQLPEQEQRYFDAVLEAYEAERRRRGALDFDDMVYECARLLEGDPRARAYWQGRFAHILMDEFQDINPMQYRVVKLLAAPPYQLFAVGDDDQSIYGFRGSSPACMKRFEEEFGAKRLLLNVNYRSSPEIVAASLKVIGENKERFSKELISSEESTLKRNMSGAGLQLRSFTDRQEQYDYLLAQLEQRDQTETTAVLFRTNSQMQELAAKLYRKGIPFQRKEQTGNIYGHFIVKDIMAYLRIAAGEADKGLWLQVMNRPPRQISREELYREGGSTKGLALLKRQLDYLRKAPLYLGVQYICRVMGYEAWLKEQSKRRTGGKSGAGEGWEEWQEILAFVKEEARENDTLQEWLERQWEYRESLRGKGPAAGESAPSLWLMTIHASKGLEFDRVCIPDCNERIFPHGNMPDEASCEEERRIFYVGMTRAKRNLELLCLTGTKECPRLPSRFLNPLLKPSRQKRTTH